MIVRLVQLDGKLPNIALMKLAHWHRAQGDKVVLSRNIYPQGNEPLDYDKVYASSIFLFSEVARNAFRSRWPMGLLGGTGSGNWQTIEEVIGQTVYESYDYADYPLFKESIGFTQRGCRLSCKFCVVPQKEGKPKSVNSIYDLWRGDPWPRKLHILDNDFFGQLQWQKRIQEIRDGKFKVCLSQGINVRMITPESAQALASIEYRNTQFNERKLYTAWDNLRDEKVFMYGVDCLGLHGIPSKHLMAYMLVGYDPSETWERIWYRFLRMTARSIEPFVMVYDRTRTDLICMARWANRGLYRIIPWPDYIRGTKSEESVAGYHKAVAT